MKKVFWVKYVDIFADWFSWKHMLSRKSKEFNRRCTITQGSLAPQFTKGSSYIYSSELNWTCDNNTKKKPKFVKNCFSSETYSRDLKPNSFILLKMSIVLD